MKVHPDASLERLLGIYEAHNPDLVRLARASTDQEFRDVTEVAIERAIKKIENGANVYARLDERGLSHLLADLLDCSGYRATAETDNNGHVDVVIESRFGSHARYLGECKMHRGYQHHVNGCAQLLGYCTGREPRAFCMDFIDAADAFTKMKLIRAEMDEKLPLAQKTAGADHEILGGFVTSHDHASGATVEILHLGCSVPKPRRA